MMTESSDIQKMLCGRCRYVIGMADREHLSIRTPDVLMYFYGGMAIITCKTCQTLNIVSDDEFEKNHPEEVVKADSSTNTVRAVFSRWYQKKEHVDRDA